MRILKAESYVPSECDSRVDAYAEERRRLVERNMKYAVREGHMCYIDNPMAENFFRSRDEYYEREKAKSSEICEKHKLEAIKNKKT